MKKFMVLSDSDYTELHDILKDELDVHYSESVSGFLCFEDVYNELKEKYNLNTENDEEENFVFVWKLEDLLKCNWEEMDIKIQSSYGESETIEHNLGDDYEISLMPYEDDESKDYQENINELFAAKDWYEFLTNEIQIIMLELILDSMKNDVAAQVHRLKTKIV